MRELKGYGIPQSNSSSFTSSIEPNKEKDSRKKFIDISNIK